MFKHLLTAVALAQVALAAPASTDTSNNGGGGGHGGGGGGWGGSGGNGGNGGGGGGGNSPPKGVSYLAQFDDLSNPSPVAIIPVDNYQALDWNSFFLITQYTGTGFVAQSPPNVAGYGIYGMILQGQPQLTPIDTSATFDLNSFYLSCAQNTAETAVALPRACAVTITGYKGSQVVATQTFNFAPTALLTTRMLQYTPSSAFRGLSKVVFANTPNDPLVATLVDDVRYTVYSK